ncbi:MAG TPA: putative metal-dependent hydrolase [Acidobacteriaceae bacterium]|jgi:hypothetical protein|nr:putative metal-dependent hydrolase [Acidobacteriaceae bacterium]
MEQDLRYPIGKFVRPQTLTAQERAEAVAALAALPKALEGAVSGLTEKQLDTPYRDGGWTVRQVVHHVADSHIQSYSRIRMALTDDWPPVIPYKEAAWAELEDAHTLPVEVSLQLLAAMHLRWATLLRSLKEEQWTKRGYKHPQMGQQTLEQVAALYAWHSRHHTAHITGLRQRMGW